jgi:hypothetical protein
VPSAASVLLLWHRSLTSQDIIQVHHHREKKIIREKKITPNANDVAVLKWRENAHVSRACIILLIFLSLRTE